MRPIDADALELEPDPWGGMNGCICVGRSGGKTMAIVQRMLKHMIKQAPTIDAVEVVRCKDCKHYGQEQEPCHGRVQRFCALHKGLVIVDKHTFCSYGERRSDV